MNPYEDFEISNRLVNRYLLCNYNISSDIDNLVTGSSLRQEKGNYPRVPDVPEPFAFVFNSDMDNPY